MVYLCSWNLAGSITVRFQAHWSPSLILLKMAKCNPIEETSGIKKNNSLHFRADKTTVSKYLGKITQSMTTSKGKLDQSWVHHRIWIWLWSLFVSINFHQTAVTRSNPNHVSIFRLKRTHRSNKVEDIANKSISGIQYYVCKHWLWLVHPRLLREPIIWNKLKLQTGPNKGPSWGSKKPLSVMAPKLTWPLSSLISLFKWLLLFRKLHLFQKTSKLNVSHWIITYN